MTPSRSAPVEIRPTSGWIGLGAVELWKHRDLASFVVDRIGDDESRAVSRWGGRIPGVVRPALRWQVEEEAR